MSNSEQPEKLAADLLKGFHRQFAENQRTREQSFLKIVGFLGAVVVGYAYVYKNLPDDNQALSFVAIASVILLLFGSAIVTVIAYSFRRDQYVNARIRKHAGIIGVGKPFPSDYDPSHIFRKRIDKLFWMPDIFFIFFLVFPLFQLIILLSYSAKRELQISFLQPNTYDTWTVFITVISLLASFIVLLSFGSKLKKKIDKWERESQQPNQRAGA